MLRSFITNFDMKIARSVDFLDMLEAVTQKEWDDWFDRYIYGPEMPEVKKGWESSLEKAIGRG